MATVTTASNTTTMTTSTLLRHDEQEDESFYDDREEFLIQDDDDDGDHHDGNDDDFDSSSNNHYHNDMDAPFDEKMIPRKSTSGPIRIQFSEKKLYGRDAEVERLQIIFHRVCLGIYKKMLAGHRYGASGATCGSGMSFMSATSAAGSSDAGGVSLGSFREDNSGGFGPHEYLEGGELDDIDDGISQTSDLLSQQTQQQQQQHHHLNHNSAKDNKNKPQSQVVFISGYSGSGKSALVNEFIKSITKQELPHLFVSGKYDELKSANPFSAISDAMGRWCHNLMKLGQEEETTIEDAMQFDQIRCDLQEALGEDAHVLTEIIPGLARVLGMEQPKQKQKQPEIHETNRPQDDNNNNLDPQEGKNTVQQRESLRSNASTTSKAIAKNVAATQDNSVMKLKFTFQKLMRALGTQQQPLIMFLDDLQWADDSNLELLRSLLSDETLQHMLFIGAYRSNEVNEQHPLTVTIKELLKLQKKRRNNGGWKNLERMKLSDLTREHINEFLSDSLHLSKKQVQPLTTAIYSKTLGNIFFTKQAIEELIRKNGIYYDMVTFQWQFLSKKEALVQLLSDDVVEMVKSKIKYMPELLQKALIIASYTRNTFDVKTLKELMNATASLQLLASEEENEVDNENCIIEEDEEEIEKELNPKQKLRRSIIKNNDMDESQRGQPKLVRSMELIKILDQAYLEGLLTHDHDAKEEGTTDCEYTFAHDRIQEAARSFVKEGTDEQYRLFHLMGNKLEELFCNGLLFASGSHEMSIEGNSTMASSAFITNEKKQEWMLFTAAHHLNALPMRYFDKYSILRLAELNLRTAKLSIKMSAFNAAAELIKKGIACVNNIDSDDDEGGNNNGNTVKWSKTNIDHYNLCLELYNLQISTEYSCGNHDQCSVAIQEVIRNARSLSDKCLAHFFSIEIIIVSKTRDFELAARKSLEILALYEIVFPGLVVEAPLAAAGEQQQQQASEIFEVKDSLVRKEQSRVKTLMKKNNKHEFIDILNSKPMDDDSILQFLEQLIRIICNLGKWRFGVILSLTAIRLSVVGGINKYLPPILTHYGMLMRQQGKYNEAFKIAYAAEKMLNKIPECRGAVWIRGQAVIQGGVLHLRRAFKHSLETYREIHRQGVPCNQVEWAAIGAMLYVLCYVASSQPITALFEPKLILYEEEARRLGQPESVCVTFSIFRQMILNLQGRDKRNRAPCRLEGVAVDEEKALSQFEKDGKIYKQTLRDFGICRLLLAIIFNDIPTIEKMVLRLEPYPEFDMPIVRQHLRFALQGLGALILWQHFKSSSSSGAAASSSVVVIPSATTGTTEATASFGGNDSRKLNSAKGKSKYYLAMGLRIMKQFKKSAYSSDMNNYGGSNGSTTNNKRGSENALPVFLCLRAVHKPSKKYYSAAITECSNGELLYLEAIMNEQCGLYQYLKNKRDVGDEYITRANQLYLDWGATGKVRQLRENYPFLK